MHDLNKSRVVAVAYGVNSNEHYVISAKVGESDDGFREVGGIALAKVPEIGISIFTIVCQS